MWCFVVVFLVFLIFISYAYFGYQNRLKRRSLWLNYTSCFPVICEDAAELIFDKQLTTIGEIGYSRFLGIPNPSRGFHLWTSLSVDKRAFYITIVEPVDMSTLPKISIPRERVSHLTALDNEWGKGGLALFISDMPAEFDPQHGGCFTIWIEATDEEVARVLNM